MMLVALPQTVQLLKWRSTQSSNLSSFWFERRIKQLTFYKILGVDSPHQLANSKLSFLNDICFRFSKAGWTPFAGMEVQGSVTRVVLRGNTVYIDGKVMFAYRINHDIAFWFLAISHMANGDKLWPFISVFFVLGHKSYQINSTNT